MNENTDPTHTPNIDLTKYVKRRLGALSGKANEKDRTKERKDLGLMTPPSSQIPLGMDDAIKSLISPPPEDILERRHSRNNSNSYSPVNNSSAKRKRPPTTLADALNIVADTNNNQPGTPYTTPNPRLRKQVKGFEMSPTTTMDIFPDAHEEPQTPTRKSASKSPAKRPPGMTSPNKPTSSSPSKHITLESPHASNLAADFIPHPVSTSTARRRGRSSTPIPSYEPPAVRFSSPKEVLMPPPPSDRRKSPGPAKKGGKGAKGKKTEMRVVTWVKKEPPEIDLGRVVDPPSPSDDPLLLKGVDLEAWLERRRRVLSSGSENTEVDNGVWHEARGEDESDSPGQARVQRDELFGCEIKDAEEEANFSIVDRGGGGVEMPVFDLVDDLNDVGSGFDSDDDSILGEGGRDKEGEGDYTENWTTMTVPTKSTPNEAKGRPISPWPKGRKMDENEGVDGDEEQGPFDFETSFEENNMDWDVAGMARGDDSGEKVETARGVEEGLDDNEVQSTETEPPSFKNVSDLVAGVGDDIDYGSSGDDEGVLDLGVVKITSDDPKAAARAAAILKLHDYDCLPCGLIKRRRHSFANVRSATKHARRKDVLGSGISKLARRTTMGGVVGDKVFLPGSPAMTLSELLIQTEVELRTPVKKTESRELLGTPEAASLSVFETNSREWVKDDWKLLDACFTDERLDVGARRGMGDEYLADVEDVEIEDVVMRFVYMMGGVDVVNAFGESWASDSLCGRVRALQKKQQSGHVAPPTPRSNTPSALSRRSVDVPDFTPLPRRPRRCKLHPTIPTPNTPFRELAPKVPASLLAPRYSHLLEKATTISQEDSSHSDASLQPLVSSEGHAALRTPLESVETRQQPTIRNRVKGFLSSYLPTLTRQTAQPKSKPGRHGLPLPPPEILGKPRGPISTPIRPSAPKPIHPKELVNLQAAPPPRSSMIPRISKPQRLVDLHHVPLPEPSDQVFLPRNRNRRSSGGSVKDLVRSFEELDDSPYRNVLELEMRSVGDIRKVQETHRKPFWRP